MTLDRFIKAQEQDYDIAMNEIRNGRKRSHWMWYIFPQIKGLGYSSTAQYYAIQDKAEAVAYMEHPILSARLVEISQELLKLDSSDAFAVLGYPDNLKLKSSMTLFYLVSENKVFKQVLGKYFAGELDKKTIESLC